MNPILWLTSNPWRAVALALALFAGWQTWSLRDTSAALVTANNNIATLNERVRAQNAHVQNWKDQSENAAEAQRIAQGKAQVVVVRQGEKADTIMLQPLPAPAAPGDTTGCADTLRLLEKFQ
jgi:hypothetical protein